MKAIHITVPGRGGAADVQEFLILDEAGRLKYRIIAYEADPDAALEELVNVCRESADPNLRVLD